ncbi:Slowmo, partial [Perkinsus olseni]
MLSSAYRALTLLFASLLVLACVMISSSAEVESDRPFRATNAEDTSLKSSVMMHEIVLPAGRLVLAWVIMSVVVGIVFVRVSASTSGKFPESTRPISVSCFSALLSFSTAGMKFFERRHVFPHDWETCTSAWWAKYPNPDQPHVKRIHTIYRNIDKENQVLQVRRIFALDYQIPDLVQKLLPKMQGYAMEDTTVDLRNKKLTAVGHNCSFSRFQKTIYTQRMSYSISGLGAVFGRRLEKAATDFSAKKAQAGEAVMSKRIDSLAATDWRNDTSSWKQNVIARLGIADQDRTAVGLCIVAMLNLAVLQGRLTAVQASEQLRAAQTRLMRSVGDGQIVSRIGRTANLLSRALKLATWKELGSLLDAWGRAAGDCTMMFSSDQQQ